MTSSVARCLVHLMHLSISYCHKIEEIITKQEGEDDDDREIIFNKLKSLELGDLPRLKRFCGHYTFKFPFLDQLTITRCPKFKTFSPGTIDTPYLKSVQLSQGWGEHREIWDTNLNKTVYQQRFVASRELVLDEDDAILIWNIDQFLADRCSQVEILGIESIADKGLTIPYALLERFPQLKALRVERCSFEQIFPSHVPPSSASFHNLRELKISKCHQLVYLVKNSSAKCLANLETLEIDDCEKLEEIVRKVPNEDVEGGITFNGLRMLKLADLPRLKIEDEDKRDLHIEDRATNSVCRSLFGQNTVLLPKIEGLELSNLSHLIPLIWDEQLSGNSFSNLKTLTVERCGFVKLVPLHVLKSLNNLEELEVWKCEKLEMVFDFEDLNDYKGMESSSVVVPLKKLKLWGLPKLKNVWSDGPRGIVSFSSLRSVNVFKCKSLTSMFPASIAKGMLRHLEDLLIYDCGIDVIVAKDQVSESVDAAFEFPQLTSLTLDSLPNLRNFYPQRHTLKWPHLQQLSIGYCDELEIFEKKVSSSSEIHEEEIALNSKYPLLPYEVIHHNLELTLKGKQVEMIGSDLFRIYHFPKVKLLHLFVKKTPTISYASLLRSFPNLERLQLSGDFEETSGGDGVAALAPRLSTFTLCSMSNMISLAPSLLSSPNLTHLQVQQCHRLTILMTSSVARCLVHLMHLSISYCDQIEEIITKQEGEDDDDREIIFSKLKSLKLVDLPRLKRFCGHNYIFKFPLLKSVTITVFPQLLLFCPGTIHAPLLESVQVGKYEPRANIWKNDLNTTIQHRFAFKEVISTTTVMALNAENITVITDVFPRVMSLYVESFQDEGVTFPYSSLERFPELHWLYVEHCSFEEIFPTQDQIVDFVGKVPPLKNLHIAHLDQLKCIWNDDSQLPPIHQNLGSLEVKSCCNLVKLAPSSASFQNLWTLSVSGCHQLIHLVTPSTAKSLVSLRRLEINDCKKMEEIVMNVTNEDVQGAITFNQLRSIELTDMPSLKMFSSRSHNFELPEVEEIQITGCPEMKMFCQGVLKTPKLSKVKIEEHDMEWKDGGDLNKIIETLSSAKDSINM